ncbi:MAG TPA: TIGR02117 family protein [Croceibacterium sp.]|nr:TIGR02117 family protein [Croceibacterium sp.]
MAATTRRRLIRGALATAGVFVAVIALFFLSAWIGSAIPRNADWHEPDHGVEIMVGTNGVHTELVLPLVSPEKDWRRHFPASDLPVPRPDATHVAVSWGEREVFLNTPTWWDLSPRTVLRIVGVGGDGLLHVAHYVRPAPSEHNRPLTLSRAEYRRLVAAIERSLPQGERILYDGYGPHDVFYEAPGRYTASNTCNQWTSDVLAEAGVRTGWWTPLAGGVMKWVPQPGA